MKLSFIEQVACLPLNESSECKVFEAVQEKYILIVIYLEDFLKIA